MDLPVKAAFGPTHLRGMLAPRVVGTLSVIVSAIGFGALGVLGKLAFAAGTSTLTLLFFRFCAAGALMTGLMTVLRLPWPRGRDLLLLVGMGGVGYVGQAFCYFSALRHASTGLTALLLYLYPALVALLSAIVWRQSLTLRKAGLVLMSFVGILCTVADSLAGTVVGIAYGVAAAMIYTVYILVGERVTSRTGAIPAGTVVMLSAAAVFGVGTAVTGAHWPDTLQGWWAMVAIAVVATVVPIIGFFMGMLRLGAADAATLSTLEPVVTLALAALVLGETLGQLQSVGAVLVIVAVIGLTRVK